MKKIVFLCGLAIVLLSCAQVKDEWEVFDTWWGNDVDSTAMESMFRPYSMQVDGASTTNQIETHLSFLENELALSDTILEDGARAPMFTTSTNAVGLAKALFSWWHSDVCVSYSGVYTWYDENGDYMHLSGRIILPKNQRPNRIVLVSHYTIGANYESPSMSFPLEGIMASRGLAVFVPDYEGYGVTSSRVHPYLCSDITASQVIGMYFAGLQFLEHIKCEPVHDDVILFGYSQGGATTMAVARKLEYEYPEVKIRLIMAGGGPYDICATYDKLIENNFTDYPCAIPMIIQGMNVGHNLNLDYSKFFKQNTIDHMDEWINSKKYAMAEITQLMGTKKMTDIMTEEACNKVSDGMQDLYLAMLNNSISTGYYPSAPVYMFHSIDDNVVPFVNATNMMSLIHGVCNVRYNFGHYGNHVAGYLRFLYTGINYLYEHEETDQKLVL